MSMGHEAIEFEINRLQDVVKQQAATIARLSAPITTSQAERVWDLPFKHFSGTTEAYCAELYEITIQEHLNNG